MSYPLRYLPFTGMLIKSRSSNSNLVYKFFVVSVNM